MCARMSVHTCTQADIFLRALNSPIWSSQSTYAVGHRPEMKAGFLPSQVRACIWVSKHTPQMASKLPKSMIQWSCIFLFTFWSRNKLYRFHYFVLFGKGRVMAVYLVIYVSFVSDTFPTVQIFLFCFFLIDFIGNLTEKITWVVFQRKWNFSCSQQEINGQNKKEGSF